MGYTRGHIVVLHKHEVERGRKRAGGGRSTQAAWYGKCDNCGWISTDRPRRWQALADIANHNWKEEKN
jgi:hypothetical protein